MDAVVQHQQHVFGPQAVLDAKEALARVVGLDGVDAGRHDAVKGFPVGGKGDAAVHVELEGRPDFAQVVGPCEFEDALEEDLGPAGDAGHNADVLLEGGPGHRLNFLLPILHQGNGTRRCAAPFAPPGEVVDDDGAEVSGQDAVVGFLGSSGAPDNQVPSAVQPGLGCSVDIHGEQVLAAL